MPSVQATAATGSQERRPPGAALWSATAWFSGAPAVARTGAMRGSVDLTFFSAMACPTHAKYREFPARAAEELASLPRGSVIGEMLSDYAVLRDQARSCS